VLLDNLSPGAGRIHWQVYLDQEKGSAAVYSTDGKQLGELELGDKAAKTKICTGVRLINKRGDIRLERLRVSRWNGDLPQKIEADKSRLHKADGTIAYGEAKAYDAQRKQFIVAPLQANSVPKAPESRVDAAQVTTIVLSRGESSPESTMSVSLQDGVRISGKLMKIANGQATLASGAIVEPISVPIAQLQSLLFMNKSQPPDRPVTWQSGDGTVRKTTKPDANAAAQPGAGRVGRLEVEGLRLHGELASGESTDQSTCLVWQPIGCNSGSPLRHGTTGQVIYRDPPPKPAAAPTVNTRAGGRVVHARVAQPAGKSFVVEPLKSAGVNPSLHLRVGDNIPCEVTKIDEKGVTFRSPVTDATFVANEKVKAVELAPEQQLKNLGKTKRERLLTLPRMQKTNPPTHLVIAKNGDYLRGRLSELNEKMLALEVRLESRQLPRDKISRIVWFHPEATEAEAKAPPLPLGEGLVQTLRRDGHRLTFQPDRCDAGVLSGKSEVLGKCRVDVSLVDQILFGKAIDDAAPQLAYHPWKLQDAPEPKFVQEDANDATSPATGTESALVGKPAPDFELPLLAGGKFKLSRQKGSIVVLDFFATWCGPCVQAMPQIDKVVEEFKDQKVKLVAVNMQEDQKQIKDLLERLDINPTVALDRDGAVAERYGVSAIPQTVVIDAEGNVARLFIGGGPKFAEQLAEAIRAVLKPAEIAN
jgi:peroxiredoxin